MRRQRGRAQRRPPASVAAASEAALVLLGRTSVMGWEGDRIAFATRAGMAYGAVLGTVLSWKSAFSPKRCAAKKSRTCRSMVGLRNPP